MSDPKTASIAFQDSWGCESIALFVSDDGDGLIASAKAFCTNINNLDPHYAEDLTANEAMFKFCMWLANPPYIEELIDEDDARKKTKYYFGQDGGDGNNSAMGHNVVNLLSGKVVNTMVL